jgi:hypothetical protein
VSGAHTFAWAAAITPSDLCTLTRQYVDSSASYQALRPVQQAVTDALVTAACTFLTSILPTLAPARKQAFIKSYDQAVQGLAKQGWLTQAQSGTLQSLANTL